jgi:hypothetical protein
MSNISWDICSASGCYAKTCCRKLKMSP